MEFWGVEVKGGKPLQVETGEGLVVHLSQACLNEVKGTGSEPIYLYVTIDGKKIVLGTLSSKKFPQQQFDLVFEKDFELSHSLKNGTVSFCGYKCEDPSDELPHGSDCSSDFSSEEEEEEIPAEVANEARGELKAPAGKQKVKMGGPEKDVKPVNEEEDSSDDSESSDGEVDSDEDEDSESDSSEAESDEEEAEEMPKENGKMSKKRPAEPASETPGPGKKAKLVTPHKNENKNGSVHVATPYPKQAGKNSAKQSKQQTPQSGGSNSSKPFNRSIKSEKAPQSSSKAKHGRRK